MQESQSSRVQDRRAVLRTVVDLTFLALALVLMVILLTDRYDASAQQSIAMEIQNLRQDVIQTDRANVLYLEGRVNRVAETSDKYQIGTSDRLQVLENRMKVLESRRVRATQRIINTNTAINNGLPDNNTTTSFSK